MSTGYRPAPPAVFSAPAHLRRESLPRRVWGDDESGEASDIVYVSNDDVHLVHFTLLPGCGFRDSDAYKTFFAADVVYYVLAGELVLANAQVGEVVRARAGEAVLVRRDTWHHGFNVGLEPARILEFIAPPPRQGTTRGYYRDVPRLECPTYVRDDEIGDWPGATIGSSATIHLVREERVLWSLEGDEQAVLVGVLVSTEHLSVGVGELRPGAASSLVRRKGGSVLYVLDGVVTVELPGAGQWFAVRPEDAFYVPTGVGHRISNREARHATFVFEIAGETRAGAGAR